MSLSAPIALPTWHGDIPSLFLRPQAMVPDGCRYGGPLHTAAQRRATGAVAAANAEKARGFIRDEQVAWAGECVRLRAAAARQDGQAVAELLGTMAGRRRVMARFLPWLRRFEADAAAYEEECRYAPQWVVDDGGPRQPLPGAAS